ncbi:Hypothetical predicted protein, partial [Paramuricea clavata]
WLTKEAPSPLYSSGNKIFLGYTGRHYMLFKPQDEFVPAFKSGLPVVHDLVTSSPSAGSGESSDESDWMLKFSLTEPLTVRLTVSPSTSSTPNDYQAAEMISGDSSDEPDTMLKFSTREHLTVPVSSSTSSAPTHHQAAEIIVISSGEDDEITIVPNAAPEPRTMKQEKVNNPKNIHIYTYKIFPCFYLKGSDDEKDTRRQATVSKKRVYEPSTYSTDSSDDDLLPRAKQSKFGPQFWDDVKVERVDSMPNDINGRKVYEVKSSGSTKLSAVRDGRNWKKDSGTQ